jgi:hypothetical protein
MARYTDAELKEKATDVLCAYNLNDPRAEMLIGILSSMTQTHPQYIFNELNRMADYNGKE